MSGSSLATIFGNNIQRKRKLLGLTQDELAERLGIGQQSLSRMERGTMAPKFERLEDIAKALYCSVPELFNSEKNSERDIEIMISDILYDLRSHEKNSILRFVSEASIIFKQNRNYIS